MHRLGRGIELVRARVGNLHFLLHEGEAVLEDAHGHDLAFGYRLLGRALPWRQGPAWPINASATTAR